MPSDLARPARFFLVLFQLLLVAGAHSADLAFRDPASAAGPVREQSDPPAFDPGPILSPQSGAPALVAWGGIFEIMLLRPPGFSTTSAEGWKVDLLTRASDPFGRMVGTEPASEFSCTVD